MYGCLGGPIGAPMVTDDRYLRFGHRRGRLRQENAEYEDFRLGRRVFTYKTFFYPKNLVKLQFFLVFANLSTFFLPPFKTE